MDAATPVTAEQLLRMPVAAYRSSACIETLSAGCDLTGGGLLHGSRCPIADRFVDH